MFLNKFILTIDIEFDIEPLKEFKILIKKSPEMDLFIKLNLENEKSIYDALFDDII
ncbi:MAG: hypothetical protein ACFE9S_17780 [Candidatus Hermodarchaeota archaeon]